MKKLFLLLLLINIPIHALRFPKWLKRNDNPELDFVRDISYLIAKKRVSYPDKTVPQYNFRIAQALKIRGDHQYKNEIKNIYYDVAEKYAFMGAKQILTKSYCSHEDIIRAEHYLHFSQILDKWRLFTFGIKNYYLKEEPLALWPLVRMHKERLSED